MSEKRARTCPVCSQPVAALRENEAFPFCSLRCKRVDLGRWLAEDYSIPAEPSDPTVADFTRPEPKPD